MPPRAVIRILLLLNGIQLLSTTGCVSGSGTSTPPSTTTTSLPAPARPVATWQNERVTLDELKDALLEAVGQDVLREYLLDLAVQREARRANIALEPGMIDRERALLVESLSDDPDRAELLLTELRDVRGLGPRRFNQLLQRSALLRAMVSSEVEVPESLARATWDSEHGPKRVARVISVDDLGTAQEVQARLASGGDFAELAATMSLDRSAPRGGLLAPVSREDPAWPLAFRNALFETEPGVPSPPVIVDGRYLLVLVEREEPASDVTYEAGFEDAMRTARLAAERLLMDRLARRLLVERDLKVIDRSIRWREDE
ncbi:MAG: peptidylprolyl isomerase [Phycisphaerales bacterium]|nr:peptidylprolyl isomerase [Phycisphaerales bacterium]